MTNSPAGMSAEKQSVALSSVWASLLLTVTKLAAGLASGSRAILSEAAHSTLDLGAALITLYAVRVGDLPADDRHMYGHGKVESLSALAETALLFITGVWVVKEALERLIHGGAEVQATYYGIGVILLSIVVDISRSRALKRVADATGSHALEADALHFSTDILSSTAVLVGLGLVWLGYPAADAVAALLVATTIFYASYSLGRRTVDVLIDAAPEGALDQLRAVATLTPGVVRVGRIRVRPAGNVLFVDIVIRVSRLLALERVEAIVADLARRIREELPEAEPFIRADPMALDDETVVESVHAIARNRALAIHDVAVIDLNGVRQISLDIEVEEDIPLSEAHVTATTLENYIRAELAGEGAGSIVVDTHLDPKRSRVLRGTTASAPRVAEVVEVIRSVSEKTPSVRGAHNIVVQSDIEGLYVSFHCLFDPNLSVRRVHDETTRVEILVREKIKGIERLVIHAEPADHREPLVRKDRGGETMPF